jgi:DNA-binding NtrC family response regulator/tetratricopeptide (TPR) repeat protein
MPDTIIDSKFRILEQLPKAGGRDRYLASDLISSQVAVLEHVALEGWERIAARWTTYWLPALRDRIARFAAHASFVPVTAAGAWQEGIYYVYATEDAGVVQGQSPSRLPTDRLLRELVSDLARANAGGDHVLNLRPEHLVLRDDRLVLLPGAWVLPLELLARAGTRSPYQPPELRHAGLFDRTSDSYLLSAVLAAVAERTAEPAPAWLELIALAQALEPERRLDVADLAARLGQPLRREDRPEAPRRSVERLADLRPAALTPLQCQAAPVLEALDAAVTQLAEGKSGVLLVEAPADGGGLQELFLHLRERLAFLTERPRVFWIDPLSSWELRDLGGPGGTILLVPDCRPTGVELLPLQRLLWEKLRPSLVVAGMRKGVELPTAEGAWPDAAAWIASLCGPEAILRTVTVGEAPLETPPQPVSAAARHLLDLLCVLEVDATADVLRQALPQQEAALPEAIVELESLGTVRRQLEAGGWWGTEPRLVLRVLRPDVLDRRLQGLSAERREELHLLISHLLEHSDARTLGQRYLRFHHLFAGGNWEAAAMESEALLKGLQRRGLEALVRQIQRKLVHSNLAQHFPLPRLLEHLRDLGVWEVERGRLAEGQGYYERAAERLFAVGDAEAGQLDLEGVTDTVLAHADLLERRVGFGRALELLQRYLERFGERLPAAERGRIFAEMAYCELRLGRFNTAEERCNLGLKLLDSRRHPKDVAQVYNVLAMIRWRTSRYEEAEQYFSTCVALREKTGDKLAMARTYNNLGLLYRAMRRFPAALDHHYRSLQIRQELGDAEGVARSMVNLGWVHLEMANLEEAEEAAQRAVALGDELGIPGTRAQAKGLLGGIYLARDRIPEARQALEEAIAETQALGDAAELFMNLRKYASLELRCGNLERAEALLQEAERYLQHAASPLEEAHWHLAYAELHRTQGDPRRAALSFEHAGNNLARLGNAPRAAEVFLTAARLYHESGVESRARDLVERARQLFSRDGAGIAPRELVDLEAILGAGERPAALLPQVDRFVEVLCRVTATAATAGSDVQALEQILGEMRGLVRARHAVLLGKDQLPHRASLIAREPGVEPPLVLSEPHLAARALQTLLPFGSDDLRGQEAAPRPFLVLPVEVRERGLGCVYLEWDAGQTAALEAALPVLRALAQHAGLALDRAASAEPRSVLGAGEPAVAGAAGAPGGDDSGLETIIGRSAARQAVIDFVRQVRDLETTVLLMGENGTGKEVVTRAIHATGIRRHYPFVTINCTAIPEALWEREMFGNERGAFTDAHETKRGFFETAHRGTLLLDEIGDMPVEMQAKFLRVLEEKTFVRIGGTDPIRVDVRIVAATNRDLDAAVASGRFRRDLYHRLNVLSLTLRPLRDRREDVPELAKHFLDLHAARLGVRPKRLSGEALRILMRYPWPGNVRELENALKGSLVLSDREVLLPEDLPEAVLRGTDGPEAAGELDIDSVAKWILDHAAYTPRSPLMPVLERALARQLVAKIGEKTRAARLLGISKPTLYTRIK